MILRDATPEDAPAIAAFWNPQIRDTAVTFNSQEKTPESIAHDIAERRAQGKAFLVASDGAEGGALIGFATYFQFRGGPGYAHTMEHTIILAPPAQGCGVGRALMQALLPHARANGVHSMFAGVSHENPGAIDFHQRLGFEIVATLPEVGFKFGRWMDLVLMQNRLT